MIVDWTEYINNLKEAIGDLKLTGENLKKAQKIYSSLESLQGLVGSPEPEVRPN